MFLEKRGIFNPTKGNVGSIWPATDSHVTYVTLSRVKEWFCPNVFWLARKSYQKSKEGSGVPRSNLMAQNCTNLRQKNSNKIYHASDAQCTMVKDIRRRYQYFMAPHTWTKFDQILDFHLILCGKCYSGVQLGMLGLSGVKTLYLWTSEYLLPDFLPISLLK